MSVLLMGVLLLVGTLVFFLLLGGLTPGNGADLVDWDPTKRAEAVAMSDHEDFQELMELNNRHRREHGLRELEEHEIRSGQRYQGEEPAPRPGQ